MNPPPQSALHLKRLFLGVSLTHTGQPQPIAGTPTDVPVPRKISSPRKSMDLTRFFIAVTPLTTNQFRQSTSQPSNSSGINPLLTCLRNLYRLPEGFILAENCDKPHEGLCSRWLHFFSTVPTTANHCISDPDGNIRTNLGISERLLQRHTASLGKICYCNLRFLQ